MRSDVFTVVKIQLKAFWVVTPWSVLVQYHCFGGPCCLHLQGEVNGTGKKGIYIGLEVEKGRGGGRKGGRPGKFYTPLFSAPFTSPWRLWQQGPLKYWYPIAALHVIKPRTPQAEYCLPSYRKKYTLYFFPAFDNRYVHMVWFLCLQ